MYSDGQVIKRGEKNKEEKMIQKVREILRDNKILCGGI